MHWLINLLFVTAFSTSSNLVFPSSTFKSAITIEQNKSVENFDSFFKRFKSDKSFQLSRTIFPLKRKFENNEGNNAFEIITQKQWRYLDVKKVKGLQISQSSNNKHEKDITLSIADTGVMVVYHFKISGSRWYFFAVTDMSD